jgi:osmotically-inducible protein OsmY
MMEEASRKSDERIHQAVLRELAWDTRVAPTEVGVQVNRGTVTLTGSVDSWAKRVAAEQAAHRVGGVLDVANDLEVRLTGAAAARSDTDIALAVRNTLEWDVMVPDQEIRSTVSQGVVTLEGTVTHWRERNDTERTIEKISGVTQVVNRIQVRPTIPADAAEIRAAIQNALERQADRLARRFDVQVRGGTVDVTGAVHTYSEKVAVLDAVRASPGVADVLDRVTVEPSAD